MKVKTYHVFVNGRKNKIITLFVKAKKDLDNLPLPIKEIYDDYQLVREFDLKEDDERIMMDCKKAYRLLEEYGYFIQRTDKFVKKVPYSIIVNDKTFEIEALDEEDSKKRPLDNQYLVPNRKWYHAFNEMLVDARINISEAREEVETFLKDAINLSTIGEEMR